VTIIEGKNPDQILALINQETARAAQGKLKIFLGMAAGVGKTYAMLQAARKVCASGAELVIGIVEHHGRLDTALLIDGLELVPRKIIDYQGTKIEEMDLDAVLARRPKIVLVDELAHTNAPGSRHNKRYLDVIEILDAGIDVYTTLNVQHVESRVSTVEEITGVRIHETVPDTLLDRADEIVLIDLPPDDLIKRLNDGLIYNQESARVARRNFFRPGNLTALREISLRVATDRVDRDLRDYSTVQGIQDAWKAGGRLMAVILPGPKSQALIRWTRRMAETMGVSWVGAYVESDRAYTKEEQHLLLKNIDLVKQLGGEVVSIRDDDLVAGLFRIAQLERVTQIIVGKSDRPFWYLLLRGRSLDHRIIEKSGDIDIYVVASNHAADADKEWLKKRQQFWASWLQVSELGWLGATIFIAWVLALGLEPWIGFRSLGILFVMIVSIAGLFFAQSSIFILACALALIEGYSFIPPANELQISSPEDLMMLVTLLIAASVVGHLTSRVSIKERALRLREKRTGILYDLAREVASAQTIQNVATVGQDALVKALALSVGIWPRDFASKSPHFQREHSFALNKKDEAVALWVLTHGVMAGRGTETLSASDFTFVPVIGRKKVVLGVIGIETYPKINELSADQLALVYAVAHQVAAGIEREL
jgi:two-component system sensor histidine kinase KdpD